MYDGAMLKEVYCELFKSTAGPRGRIQFHQGLNTVLGGEAADNSIGKSTFLLILDYCFGGETYGKANVKNYVGDHTICFAFHFRDGDHYYSRTVSDSKHVNRCNSEYQPVGDPIDLKAFRQELFDGYEIALEDITFRDMVGRFFRISGKGNDEIENPLHYKSPKGEQAVTAMEKLFGMYQFVGALKKRLKEADEKKKTFNKARRLKLVPSAIKTDKQYAKNIARIDELQVELAGLTKDTDSDLLEKELQRKSEEAEAASRLRGMKRQYGRLASQYRVVTKNRDDAFVTTEDNLQTLASYFPTVNIKRIEEVEAFHRKLHGILDSELSDEAQSLQVLMQAATQEIQKLEAELVELGIPIQVPKPFLEKYSELQREISALESQNEAFEQTEQFKADVETVEKDLDVAESQVLRDIEDMLNAQMVRYNDRVYEVRREAPTIKFESKAKYDFHTPRDDGKGTAFKSLIVLDLSILELTELPAIAHDSSIFKNIGDLPIDGIMDIYLESKKQIFIAFDKEGAYTKKVADAVTDTAVIKLGENGDQLFGWTWAIKEGK
ncbi:MAG: DUF2326 domain-containing protein [Lachnospiraceae bacterium]|nr:DUF2326 domain-containing protein [Massilistercora timonensis]